MTDGTIGTTYRAPCEHVTGTGPAPWSGEEVAYADCPEPATRQPDGSYKCWRHDRRGMMRRPTDAEAREAGYTDAAEIEEIRRERGYGAILR